MDRAFVITGTGQNGDNGKPMAGIFFSNAPPPFSLLNSLGFQDISRFEVKPESKQPTEPTIYIYERTPSAFGVSIVRLGWDGNIVGKADIGGNPPEMIPPVSGEAADQHLYFPRAHLIKATSRDNGRHVPVFGVLLVRPKPGEPLVRPDGKTLKDLGLGKVDSVCQIEPPRAFAGEPTLYVVERDPSAKRVTEVKLDAGGSRRSVRSLKGAPGDIIPPIGGNGADRFNSMFGQSPPLRRSTVPPEPARDPQKPASKKPPSVRPKAKGIRR